MGGAEDKQATEGSARHGLPAGYVLRLAGLLGIGVLVCAWLSRYTDIFPEVATLLALGGIFSWIAVAFQLLPESRVEALQAGLDRAVLCSPRTNWWGGGLAIVLVVLANSYGALRLESPMGEAPAAVVVRRLPDGGTEELTVASGERVNLLVRADWWRAASLQVKVSGFPDRMVTLLPWAREPLSVPQSFQRTVVLLRPSASLYKEVRNNPMTLRVTHAGRTFEQKFDGIPVWLSSDGDLAVPAELRTEWSFAVPPAEAAYFVHVWSRPRAFFSERQETPPGTELTVQLQYPNNAPCYPQPRKVTVFGLGKSRSFVQEEVLDVCAQTSP